MKISNWIIGLLIVSLIAVTFTTGISDFSSKYGVTYDDDELGAFAKHEELINLTNDIKDKEESQTTSSGITDIVGDYIGKAVDTLKLAKTSLGMFDDMVNAAGNKIGLPTYFITIFMAIGLILIIIGVIVSAMLKKDV